MSKTVCKDIYVGPYVEYIATRGNPSVHDVVGESLSCVNTETGTHHDTVWLVMNERRENDPRFDLRDDDEFLLDITSSDIIGQIQWFESAFANEIQKLTLVYASVVIKWGVCQYATRT